VYVAASCYNNHQLPELYGKPLSKSTNKQET